MRSVLLDSLIYITALRAGDDAVLALRRLAPEAPVWLSAVVLEELYAGVSLRNRRVVERLERDFDRARRILVPNLNDWTQAGKVLARLNDIFPMEKQHEKYFTIWYGVFDRAQRTLAYSNAGHPPGLLWGHVSNVPPPGPGPRSGLPSGSGGRTH